MVVLFMHMFLAPCSCQGSLFYAKQTFDNLQELAGAVLILLVGLPKGQRIFWDKLWEIIYESVIGVIRAQFPTAQVTARGFWQATQMLSEMVCLVVLGGVGSLVWPRWGAV